MLITTRRRMLAGVATISAAAGVMALAQNLQYLQPLAQFVNTRLQ